MRSKAKDAAIAVWRLILENIVQDVEAEEKRIAMLKSRVEETRRLDRKRDE